MINGVGPAWAPKYVRVALTWFSGLFFNWASWARHDQGYAEGGDAARRAEIDMKFLRAMLCDAAILGSPFRMLAGCLLAWFFWAMVRAFGWASFEYRGRPWWRFPGGKA